MRLLAIALLLALPFLEISVFTVTASAAGFWPALSGLLTTTLSGIVLLRWQGPRTLKRLNIALHSGSEAGVLLIDAVGLVVAAILLLAPGFVTDLIALPLAVPAVRRFIGRFVVSGMRGKSAFRVFMASAVDESGTADLSAKPWAPGPTKGETTVIDGEFRDVTPAPPPAPLPSPEPSRKP